MAVPSSGDTPALSFTRDLPLTQLAVQFAEEHHADQRRAADGAEFLVHPLEVASLLERSHYPDHVVAAAVLHDVLEDTDAQRSDLDARFGREVGELVDAVSDDLLIEDEEARKDDVRERVRRLGGYAPVVYAARPAYYAPAPVVYPAPYYYAAPVIGFGIGYWAGRAWHGGHRYGYGYHGGYRR